MKTTPIQFRLDNSDYQDVYKFINDKKQKAKKEGIKLTKGNILLKIIKFYREHTND
jgi:hypothetical protein